jgi:hypothetical protein
MTTTETTSVTVDGAEITVGGIYAGRTVIEIDPARGGDVVIVSTDADGEHFTCVEVDNPIVITTYTTIYGPWPTDEDGDPIGDGPEPIDQTEDTERFATVSEAAEWLADYACESSERPLTGDLSRVWWVGETYVHPYNGTMEDTTYVVTTGDAHAVNLAVSELV